MRGIDITGSQEVLKNELSRFGDRVSFDEIERLLYSHDIAVLPANVKRLIEDMPFAVVRPLFVDELIFLVKMSRKHGIPLVPRGSGTSGVGGVIPTKGGVVVDFCEMNKILRIDENEMTATVEPGVVWQSLEAALNKVALALRLYPTSGLSSTVGGWVAEGGVGIGSFEYGYIKDNIANAKVVTPEGEVHVAEGNDLDLVNECEGTTGFITEVTINTRPMSKTVPVVALFPDIRHLLHSLIKIVERRLPLWSVTFITPEFIRLRQKATGKLTLSEDRYVGVFAYPESRDLKVKAPLYEIIEMNAGSVADPKTAQDEWEERFFPLRLKSLGPSLIPSEAIIPVEKIEVVFKEIKKKIGNEIAIEGSMAGKDKCSIRGYILRDERSRTYPISYLKSLSFVDIAEKNGGEVYSIGMYFTDKAERRFGKERFSRLVEYKAKVDPDRLLNPGKIIPPSIDSKSPIRKLGHTIKLARKFKFAAGMVEKLLGK